jgi:dGTPase
MLTREALEALEEGTLAPYAARSAASAGRVHEEPDPVFRTCYQRDRDRIVHCTAFRRLEYKTQVFVNHEGDHYRTRLTHTLEVAQIGRTIARTLRLNEDMTEAAALAHDLGHTPFGHSGEEALQTLMREHGGFEHNRHGLRVVDRLEKLYPDFDGLNLTYEVREAIAKHTTRHDAPADAGFDPTRRAVLEAQVVEAADSIAYDNHDLEDSLNAGILTPERLAGVDLWREALAEVRSRYPTVSHRETWYQAKRFLINLEVGDLIRASHERIAAAAPADRREAVQRARNLIGFSEAMQARKEELGSFLFDNVYRHYRVARMASKAKRFIAELFAAYVADARQLPPEYQERCAEEGVHRVACDYIAGMTDRYAQDEYTKLFHPFERV